MEKIAVVSDIHAYADLFERAIDSYPEDVSWIIGGDLVDGPQVRKFFDLVLSMSGRIRVTRGNHCLGALASMTDIDPERRDMWLREYWAPPGAKHRMERGTFSSYGIDKQLSLEEKAKALYEIMSELGHLSILEGATNYYENDDIIVVHAGLGAHSPWPQQRAQLDEYDEAARNHIFHEPPIQVVDNEFQLANGWDLPPDLGKTLITGHTHIPSGPRGRRLGYGLLGDPVAHSRVKLASQLWKGDPLYIYQAWDRQLVPFKQ